MSNQEITHKIETDISVARAHWQVRTLRSDEVPAMSQLELVTPDADSPDVGLHLNRTPYEFRELYAALERQVADLGDVTLLTGEALGAERPYVLGVSSALRGEGKTIVALHLALSIANDTFKKVCLVDLSLGDDQIGKYLGVKAPKGGMIDALEEIDTIVPSLQMAGLENLVIIPAGREPRNPAKLARSPRIAELIVSTRQIFDVVIVDMPAVSTNDALPLARHMDGIVVVTQSGTTPANLINETIDILGRKRVVGVVMNRYKSSLPRWLQKLFIRE